MTSHHDVTQAIWAASGERRSLPKWSPRRRAGDVGAGGSVVLLADDEKGILEVLGRLLRDQGYPLFLADSLTAAMDALQGNAVKRAIIDARWQSAATFPVNVINACLVADIPTRIFTGWPEAVPPAFTGLVIEKPRYDLVLQWLADLGGPELP